MSEHTEKSILVLDLNTLLDASGVEGLNELLDEHLVENGVSGIASDISYRVVEVQDGNIVIEATYFLDGDADDESSFE